MNKKAIDILCSLLKNKNIEYINKCGAVHLEYNNKKYCICESSVDNSKLVMLYLSPEQIMKILQ